MSEGTFFRILQERYGEPMREVGSDRLRKLMKGNVDVTIGECCWNLDNKKKSVLYTGGEKSKELEVPSEVAGLYGEFIGGTLLSSSVKIALRRQCNMFHLYTLPQLHNRISSDFNHESMADIFFFMEAANIYYYGIRQGEIFVFDAETLDLDSIGPVDNAINQILEEWESAIL